jgi:membrane protease YdiL (CAAX protease family)
VRGARDVAPAIRRGPKGPEEQAPVNAFGLAEALGGLAVGFVLAAIAVSAVSAALHHASGGGAKLAVDAASLIGLWAGFAGAAVVASRRREAAVAVASGTSPAQARRPILQALRDDYGLVLRLWPDVPLGVVVGVASQYLLVPVLELPLLPFVPRLFHRLSEPAQSLTSNEHGALLALLGILVCLGSPLVEELFFRGLLLRALAGRLIGLGRSLGPVVAVVVTSLVFSLVHFEALQFSALAGFGIVLCLLAWRTRRLGPGIVAHASFNATTFIALAFAHTR